MPFYSGWGLTRDRKKCERRSAKLSLQQLVAGALIRYPLYLNPLTQKRCEVEELIDCVTLQLPQEGEVEVCYAYGFSLWKCFFVSAFVGRSARKLVFVNKVEGLSRLVTKEDALLVWGKRDQRVAKDKPAGC